MGSYIDKGARVAGKVPYLGAAVTPYLWVSTHLQDTKDFMSPEEQQTSGHIPTENLEPQIQEDLGQRRTRRGWTYLLEDVADPSFINLLSSDRTVPSFGELWNPTTEEAKVQKDESYGKQLWGAAQDAASNITKVSAMIAEPSLFAPSIFGRK